MTVAVVIVATAAVAERSLATRSSMQAINDDVVHSTMIHFTGKDRDTAVTSLVRDAAGLRLTVMVTDDRPFALSERMSYRMIMPDAFGGRAFTYAKEAHLVTRFSGRLHCSKRLMMPDRVEVADSYRGPAAWSHPIMIPISRRVPWRLAGDTMDRLCSTPGRGEIVQRIPR